MNSCHLTTFQNFVNLDLRFMKWIEEGNYYRGETLTCGRTDISYFWIWWLHLTYAYPICSRLYSFVVVSIWNNVADIQFRCGHNLMECGGVVVYICICSCSRSNFKLSRYISVNFSNRTKKCSRDWFTFKW